MKGTDVMLHPMESSARLFRASVLAVLVIGVPSLLFAEDDTPNDLQRCVALNDAVARLSCYDKISGRNVSVEEVVSTPDAVPPDSLGSESLRRKDETKAEEAAVLARVSRCTKSSGDKYFFYLDGGQVWKQVSDKKLYFRECDFIVTISKDFFGYKMQQEGSKTKFRVSRVR